MTDWALLRYERTLPVSVDDAYAWLTDYDADDPDRTDEIIVERVPVEKSEDRIVLEGRLSYMGRDNEGWAEVELDPPDHWTAHVYDDKDRQGGRFEYRLQPTDTGSRLVVDYNLVTPRLRDRVLLTLAKPLLRRRIDAMWDGLVASMVDELGVDDAPS